MTGNRRELPPSKADPGLSDLSKRDYLAIIRRAGNETLDDNVPMIASALAYSAFLAIPSTLLVATGLFTLVAGPDTISNLIQHLGQIAPKETVTLLNDSLQRLNDHPATSVVMTIVGFVIALWATTGAMNAFMTGLNIAYDRKDSRNFMKKRIVALGLTACMVLAGLLVLGLLVLGPHVSRWVGDATGAPGLVSALWWAAQWPVLVLGLLAAFATMLYLGPDVEHGTWRFVTPGAVVAVAAWLAASGLFAVYDELNLIEAVAEDRDSGGERHAREADAEHGDPGLQIPRRPDQPRRHDQRGRRRGDRADREHELELLTLEATRAPQANDHRRRSEPDPGPHEEPAGEVDRVHRPTRTREAERVRYLRERLGVAARA